MTWPAPGRPLLARGLIGRQAEQAALRRAVADLRVGRGAAVAVVGERGVGKSRLLREIEQEASAGSRTLVLRGRAVPDGRTPYRPLAEAFVPLIDPAATERLPVAVRAGLRALAPHRIPDGRSIEPTPLVVAESLCRLLIPRPRPQCGVLVVLEDLHWADPETLEAVEHLAERASEEELLLVTATRDDEPSRALALVRRMQARRAVEVIRLDRLAPADVRALAADALGAAPSAELVQALEPADGLPFLVEEILTSLALSGAMRPSDTGWHLVGDVRVVPSLVLDLVRDRRDTVSPQARRLLEAAAVVGDLRDGLAAASTGLAPHAAGPAAAELVDMGLLQEDHGRLGFRHALVRQAVLDLVPGEQAAALAARALEALEALDPALPRTRLDRAVELADRAGDAATTARLLTLAGRRAFAAGALVSAAQALRAARRKARFDQRMDVDEVLTSVLAEAGLADECTEIGESLLHALAVTRAPPDRALAVRVRLAKVAVAAGRDAERQFAEADRLLREAGAAGTSGSRRTLALLRAQAALDAGDLDAAAAAARPACDGPPDVAAAGWIVLGRCARAGDPDAAREAFSRSLAVAEAADLPVERLRALGELGTVDLLATGPRDRLEQALRLAVDCGAWAAAVGIETQLAWWWEDRGSGADVVRHAVAAAELAQRLRSPVSVALARTAEAVGRALEGDEVGAERALALARACAPDHPDVMAAADGHGSALLALRDDDRDLALAHLRRATSRLVDRHHPPPMPMWGLWALLEVITGDGGGRAVDRVRELGLEIHVMIRGYLALADAVLAGRRGDEEAVAREVAAAEQRLSGLQPFHALAVRHVAAAAMEEGWGTPVPWLTAALPELDRHGLTAPASAARALLRRMGRSPGRRRPAVGIPPAWSALGVTAREAEVLALLGAGEPTRTIAQRLYLSVKTVERHTANLAAKAGVSGRDQLVAFAARSVAEHGGSPDATQLSPRPG